MKLIPTKLELLRDVDRDLATALRRADELEEWLLAARTSEARDVVAELIAAEGGDRTDH